MKGEQPIKQKSLCMGLTTSYILCEGIFLYSNIFHHFFHTSHNKIYTRIPRQMNKYETTQAILQVSPIMGTKISETMAVPTPPPKINRHVLKAPTASKKFLQASNFSAKLYWYHKLVPYKTLLNYGVFVFFYLFLFCISFTIFFVYTNAPSLFI